MASIENSLKYESEVVAGKIRLITSGDFVRAYNHSAWSFYCLRFYPDVLRIKRNQAKKFGGES